MNPRRLYRTSDDRIIAGVAGGVADHFDIDPVIVRILWFLSVFFTGSITFWVYVLMAIVVPEEPDTWPQPSPWAPGGAPIGSSGPGGSGPGGSGASAVPGAYPAGAYPAAGPSSGAAPATADATGAAPGGTSGGYGPDSTPGAPGAPDATAAPGSGSGTAPAWNSTPWQSAAPGGSWPNDPRSQRRQEKWERRQERWERRMERRANRDRTPGLVFGLLLILVGGLFAWNAIDPRFDISVTWPVVVIALGAVLVVSAVLPRGGNRHD